MIKSSMTKLGENKLKDQDNTSVQGFEKASQNIIYVDPRDCSHCLRPFNETGRKSNMVNVITAHGKDQWCEDCADKGVEKGICIRESRLSKEEKKLWEKKFRKKLYE